MQGLVYIFIALAALGVAVAAYLGLTFTPIEAIVCALCFGAVAILLMERQLRQRSEARLERAVEDLARLLSTDAQAGQVLSQRINQLADTNASNRLDNIEADISVLGTVVRQVAEAVAEIEEKQRKGITFSADSEAELEPLAADDDALAEPIITIEILKQAMDEGRLVCHIEPIVQLPARRPHGYDVVTRLMLEDGDFADRADFMPRRGHADIIRSIDAIALDESVTIARRSRTVGQPIRLYMPLTRETLTNPQTVESVLSILDANRAISSSLAFAISQADWKQLMPSDKLMLSQMNRLGIGFSLIEASSLRFDFGELEGLGFHSVRVDATRYLRDPGQFTDFHAADVAPYAKRFHIDLVATGILDEQQVLTLFEDGVGFVQGPYIAGPGPVRADLVADRNAEKPLRRAEM